MSQATDFSSSGIQLTSQAIRVGQSSFPPSSMAAPLITGAWIATFFPRRRRMGRVDVTRIAILIYLHGSDETSCRSPLRSSHAWRHPMLRHSRMQTLGSPAANFSLPDPSGRVHSLRDFDDAHALLVAFLC